jgi:hypothetical protein
MLGCGGYSSEDQVRPRDRPLRYDADRVTKAVNSSEVVVVVAAKVDVCWWMEGAGSLFQDSNEPFHAVPRPDQRGPG